jgi:hypothetical protein
MKKLLVIAVAVAGLTVFAADKAKDKEKSIDIKGEGKCAKCALKEKDACQNVVVVEKGGKKTTYYFVHNDVSKAFHKNLCQGSAKVKATGTCKEVSGKMEFTATKIELDKDAK